MSSPTTAPRNRYFAVSAQQVDPLSWLTSRQLSLVLGILILAFGVFATVVTWDQTPLPYLQLVAAAMFALACAIIYIATRPLLQPIGWLGSVAALLAAVAAVEISAFGYASSGTVLEWWWAPVGLAVVIASLGPSLAARKVLVLGIVSTLVATSAGAAILASPSDAWGLASTTVIIAYLPALVTAATVGFSYAAVQSILSILEAPSRVVVPASNVRDPAAEALERVMLAQLSARAAPFLEGLADSGIVTPADRALAGQLARRLRDELVTQSSLSWLDSIASKSRLVVVDPDHRARRMNGVQRTALRALLQAILDTPGADSSSLMVELRKAPDGATAVGVSLDMALPEGRRIMLLAPYYLTLKTVVDDLTTGRDGITFRISPEGER